MWYNIYSERDRDTTGNQRKHKCTKPSGMLMRSAYHLSPIAKLNQKNISEKG